MYNEDFGQSPCKCWWANPACFQRQGAKVAKFCEFFFVFLASLR